MNLRQLFCVLLAFVVICSGLFSVSVYASEVDGFIDYNGHFLPDIDSFYTNKDTYPNVYIWQVDGGSTYRFIAFTTTPYYNGKFYYGGNGSYYTADYSPSTKKWTVYGSNSYTDTESWSLNSSYIVWSNFDIVDTSTGSIIISGNKLSTSTITSTDFMSVITDIQSQISVSTIVEVLGVTATAIVGLAFMWWGVRKVTRALMSAFKKGKISF